MRWWIAKTVYAVVVVAALLLISPLSAANEELEDLIDQLYSPVGFERAKAAAELVDSDEDELPWRIEQEWKRAPESVRFILLDIMEKRSDPKLIEEVEDWIFDERLSYYALPYLRSISTKDLEIGDEDWLPFIFRHRVQYRLTRMAIKQGYGSIRPDYSELLKEPEAIPALFKIFVGDELRGIEDGLSDALNDLPPYSRLYQRVANMSRLEEAFQVYFKEVEDPRGVRHQVEVTGHILIATAQAIGDSTYPEFKGLEAHYLRYRAHNIQREVQSYTLAVDVREAFLIGLYQMGQKVYFDKYIEAKKKEAQKMRLNGTPWFFVPSYFYVELNIGLLYLRAEQFEEAEDAYDELIEDALDEFGKSKLKRSAYEGLLSVSYWNKARAQAAQFRSHDAWQSLKKAEEWDFDDWKLLPHEPVFECLYWFDEFNEWFESIAPPAVWAEYKEKKEGG